MKVLGLAHASPDGCADRALQRRSEGAHGRWYRPKHGLGSLCDGMEAWCSGAAPQEPGIPFGAPDVPRSCPARWVRISPIPDNSKMLSEIWGVDQIQNNSQKFGLPGDISRVVFLLQNIRHLIRPPDSPLIPVIPPCKLLLVSESSREAN